MEKEGKHIWRNTDKKSMFKNNNELVTLRGDFEKTRHEKVSVKRMNK